MMKKLFNYTDEAQALIKEKMEAGKVEMDYKVVWGFLNEIEEKIEDVELNQGWAPQVLDLGWAEYLILTDEEAEKAARESLENLIDDCGVQCFNLDLLHYIDKDWMEEAMREDLWYLINESYDEETLEETMEEYGAVDEDDLLEKMADDRGAFSYFSEIYSDKDLITYATSSGALNIEEIIDDVINWYGRGHELATYDGCEIEFPVGEDETYYAYRIN